MRPPITDYQFSALMGEYKGIIYKDRQFLLRNAEDGKDLIQKSSSTCGNPTPDTTTALSYPPG